MRRALRHPSKISSCDGEDVEKQTPEPAQGDLLETSVQALTHPTMEQFFGDMSGAALTAEYILEPFAGSRIELYPSFTNFRSLACWIPVHGQLCP
jgi:hypothetical protein